MAPAGTFPSSSPPLAGSRPNSTQYTWVPPIPPGPSGSSKSKTISTVPSGTSDHFSGGEMLSPSQVYWMGTNAWSAKAGLVSVSVIVSGSYRSRGCRPRAGRCAGRVGRQPASTIRRHIRQYCGGHPLTDLTRLLRILVERFVLVVHRYALLFRHLDLDRANRQVRVCPRHDRRVAGNIGELEERKASIPTVSGFEGRIICRQADVDHPNYSSRTASRGRPLAAPGAVQTGQLIAREIEPKPGRLLRGKHITGAARPGRDIRGIVQ